MSDSEIETYVNDNYVCLVGVDDSHKEQIYLFKNDCEQELIVISR